MNRTLLLLVVVVVGWAVLSGALDPLSPTPPVGPAPPQPLQRAAPSTRNPSPSAGVSTTLDSRPAPLAVGQPSIFSNATGGSVRRV